VLFYYMRLRPGAAPVVSCGAEKKLPLPLHVFRPFVACQRATNLRGGKIFMHLHRNEKLCASFPAAPKGRGNGTSGSFFYAQAWKKSLFLPKEALG
jgi:hypothetical protein